MGFPHLMRDRRQFLRGAGLALGGVALADAFPFSNRLCAAQTVATAAAAAAKADYTLRIEPVALEIAPGVTVKTVAYNGQVPGPVLRLKEGVPVAIDVTNASKTADLVHWHGLHIDSLNDGAMEEGSPMIEPGKTLRYNVTPRPAGTRWYHTHAGAGTDLTAGTYSGQYGFLIVEGKEEKGDYDQEVLLAVHHWEGGFVPMVETMRMESANKPMTSGSDVGYKHATMNRHKLGAGEPVRVKEGERVLFRLLNASATENVVLALPGHSFKVMAMDGNPVPEPKTVETISLAVAERVDAIVEMKTPGVWVLGSTLEESRKMGLGVVVEYAGRAGKPEWKDPAPAAWDYGQFSSAKAAPEPEETIKMFFRSLGVKEGSKFNTWAINGRAWPDVDPILLKTGRRYRLEMLNASGDQHPVHLHRHSFEVTRVGKQTMSGLKKDVLNLMPLQAASVDFVADNPGDTLFHCHQQLHMDFGFMTLLKYVG